jgi:hypothetical protein
MTHKKNALGTEQGAIKRLKPAVEELTSKWLSAEDDAAWKEWVDYRSREKWDLIKLLSSDARDSMKRRALFLLFVPSLELSSVYWEKDEYRMISCMEPDFLEKLSADSLEFVCEMLTIFVPALAPLHRAKPENLVERGEGFAMFMSVPDKYHDALYFYNSCIPTLLPLVPEELGEKIFHLFNLNDISSYWDMNGSSGYNPFQHLMCYTENIDENWKREADARMQKIILDELAGKTFPRKEHEGELGCYAHIIQLQLWDRENKLPYSVELLASQLEFIVNNQPLGKNYIEDYHIGKILRLLSDEKYKALRHKLARMVVFADEGDFSKAYLYDAVRAQAAEMMIAEFGEIDPELREKLEWFIEEGKKKIELAEKEKSAKNEIEKGICVAME